MHCCKNISGRQETQKKSGDEALLPRPTFLAHARPEALLEPAVATLVALVLIHNAIPTEAARIDMILAHATAEEPLAAIATRRSIVLARRPITTDGAVLADALGCQGGGRDRRCAEP